MSIILKVKKSIRPFRFPHKTSLVASLSVLTLMSTISISFAQTSSDYHPGAGIKFHDLSGGSNSASTSASSSAGVSEGGSSSLTTSPSATSSTSAASGSSSPTTPDATAAGAETGEKGFGSFLKNVVRAGAQVGNLQQNNYGSGQSYSNYGNASQNYSRPNTNSYSGNHGGQQNNNTYQVQGGNPFPGRHSAYDGAQNQVPINGTPMEILTRNPPGPVDGDLENLMPKEIHTKAYGPEVHRNGPLNGAEDNTHIF